MKTFLAVVACCLVVLGNCRGAISFDLVTWDAGDGEFNWVSRDGVATVANTGGTLGMDFDALENTDSMQNATDYTGDYTAYSNLKVSFDWLGYAGTAQSLFFESSEGSGATWEYVLTGTGAFQPYEVSFASAAGWNEVTTTGDPFFLSLQNVDLIGFSVLNAGVDRTWDLDNWQFFLDDDVGAVPEPGTVSFIVVALGSAVLTYRRRRAPAKA